MPQSSAEPANHGKEWTEAEELRLLQEFRAGFKLSTLCSAHDRTANAVLTRLVRLGVVAVRNRAYYALMPQPYATFEEARDGQQA